MESVSWFVRRKKEYPIIKAGRKAQLLLGSSRHVSTRRHVRRFDRVETSVSSRVDVRQARHSQKYMGSTRSTFHVSSQSSSSCRARRDERVEPVELVVSSVSRRACRAIRTSRVEPCSSSSTQPKCMDSTRRTCRIVSCRNVTSQVKFGL